MKIDLPRGDESPRQQEHDELVAAALVAAKKELQEFEDSITPDVLLERLNTEFPAHPLLLIYKFCLGLLSVGIVLALTVLALPLFPGNLLIMVAELEDRIELPIPLVLTVLAFCFGFFGAGVRQLAVIRAERSPMRPAERKTFQRLSNEVHRLQSAKSLEDNKYVSY